MVLRRWESENLVLQGKLIKAELPASKIGNAEVPSISGVRINVGRVALILRRSK